MKNLNTAKMLGGGRGASAKGFGGRANVDFKLFFDRPTILAAVDKKNRAVLSKTGLDVRQKMRASIRPPKQSRKPQNVTIGGRVYVVPLRGMVYDQATGRKASTTIATEARRTLAQRRTREGVGKPPRRGKLDLLRKFIFFAYDKARQSVVIAPLVFASQPRLIGADSVPELLEFGGKERFRAADGSSYLADYGPRPFVLPLDDFARQRFAHHLENVPLK